MKTIVLLILSIATARADITESYLDKVAMIESSNNPKAIGDDGKARGAFQIHKAAWQEAQKKNPSIGDYESGSFNTQSSRLAAKTYLTILSARFEKRTGRKPSDAELYAVWNCGLGSFFSKHKGDLNKVPITTKKAISKL